MLGYLPVIFFGAAVPGPFRAVAITLWTLLFPESPGQMAAFGLVQHNFFVFFNAAIGLLFLRRTNRELARAGAAAALIESRVETTSAQPSARTSPAPGQPRPSASRTTGTATITKYAMPFQRPSELARSPRERISFESSVYWSEGDRDQRREQPGQRADARRAPPRRC